MTARKIRNSWRIDIRHNRTRYRMKSPDNSKSGAQAYEAYLRRKLANGESIVEVQTSEERDQLFGEFADVWFKTYVVTNNKASEARRKKYTLKNSIVPFFGKTPINQITTLQVERFKAKKMKQGLANKTINNHLSVLGKCLSTAEEWLDLEKTPKIKLLKLPPSENDFLTKEECSVLLENLKNPWHDIVLTAIKTGLRMGELRGLKWQDINWENRSLTVRHTWCDYKKDLVAPKSNRSRNIPLTGGVYVDLLTRKGRGVGFVFTEKGGGRFNDKSLNREIKKACKKTGLRKVTCHTLRHTFASHLAMAGAPLGAIQRLLGHADIQTTMRYAHLSNSTLENVIGLLEPENYGHYMGTTTPDELENSDAIRVPSNDMSLR